MSTMAAGMSTDSASPAPQQVDAHEESGLFEDLRIPDQDDAQAVLQPAMSAAAVHLTSCHTPAIEKAAALGPEDGVDGFGDGDGDVDVDGEGDGDGDGDVDGDVGEQEDGSGDTTPEYAASPKAASPRKPRQPSPGFGFNGKRKTPRLSIDRMPVNDANSPHQRGLPSPWRAQSRQIFTTTKDPHSSETRGILGMAFGPTRERSRSAGQEALKKLQRAFPSLASPSHLLPSLPTSFFSSFTDGRSGSRTSGRSNTLPADRQGPALGSLSRARSRTLPKLDHDDPAPVVRPHVLRRVTSDDSMLYNTLSRNSSLGDDDQFMDVRGMVSTRLMAIKDSLPDVPNFKMPSLAKIQAASKLSALSLNGISLNGIFSNDTPANGQNGGVDRDQTHALGIDSSTLDAVLEDLTGDIVIMGGYRGSILRSADPPHHQLWAPVKVGLNMRKANLEVGLDDEDEETADDHIIASGMLQNIGPIDISRKFFKKLRSCENARTGKLRVWDYGYDWRLSPSRLSERLLDFLQTLPSNQPGVPVPQRGALVIAHSLGGLITRHAVNERPELFSGVLYAGTPQRCVNILGPLRNGDAVLFNDKLLTAQVNFSIRTSFALLPDDGFCFVDKNTGEEYPVDFFDAASWVRWRLSPSVAPPLPPYNKQQQYLPLSSLLPNSLLRPRGDCKPTTGTSKESPVANIQNRTAISPHLSSHTNTHTQASASAATAIATAAAANGSSSSPSSPAVDPDRLERNMEYLQRTLTSISQFRRETAHRPHHEAGNAYPPFAVIYGKSIPTVYAARVNGRDSIPCSDAYDDLIFRPGDGVVLAKESMLPEGYSVVHGGRIRTERGHITMLGDMPALGKALKALLRGRRKGIGLGEAPA